jgi:peptidoglycan hydrolase-like protein with peptidoglycan-binding domain
VHARGVLGVALAAGALYLPGPALASPQQAGDQVALRALGFYHGPIDGQIGPLTRAAIEAAQTRAHLPATGVMNTPTRESFGKLGQPLFGKRQISAGQFGLDVSVLQFLLARSGFYHGPIDGYMGAKLELAVRAFQQHEGLGVDGIAGPETLKTLVISVRTSHRHHAAPPVQPHETYVVQAGDSLTAIAAHYEISMPRLASLNHLDPAKALLIGTKLSVPVTTARASLAASPTDVRSALDAWAARLGVSPHLVRALSWMESGYQPGVVSSVGARGILQVMPQTRDWVEQVLLGHPVPHTVDGDAEVGILYLRHLLGEFGGDTRLALAAWYQGAAAVRKFGLYEMTKPFVADVLALSLRM